MSQPNHECLYSVRLLRTERGPRAWAFERRTGADVGARDYASETEALAAIRAHAGAGTPVRVTMNFSDPSRVVLA